MSFRFDFGADKDNHNQVLSGTSPSSSDELHAEALQYRTQELAFFGLEEIQITPAFSICKGFVSSQAASCLLHSGELAVSDLIPGKYEGGFKLWECAVDMCKFLCQHWGVDGDPAEFESSPQAQQLKGKRVLELGCGQGLPGILAALLGTEVHFQDYNREVLTALTMPNLACNLQRLPDKGGSQMPAKFFAGGWSSLQSLLRREGLSETYNFVLSTDTIYSLESQQQLLACITASLKPGGVAFIGAKSYYFGVGGSTAAFKKMAMESGVFCVNTVQVLDDGASNVREIMLLTKQSD